MAQGRRITPGDLDLPVTVEEAPPLSLKEARSETERRLLVEALQRHRGNISQAAKAIQISRPAFHELLTKHKISAEDYKRVEK